jgi:hypothetical protein
MTKGPSSDDELLNYLDGKLSDAQARSLKAKLEASSSLELRLHELRAIHNMLGKGKLETPSSNFTHRVMNSLHRAPIKASLSPRNGLLLFCGTMVALGILSLLLSGGLFDNVGGSITLDQITLDKIPGSKEFFDGPVSPISLSGKWMINALMVVILGLGFVLLDRTVLRPWFNKRLNSF